MSQNTQILNHLMRAPITPMEALNLYQCYRLAARIGDLKKRKYAIERVMIEANGKRFAQYSLKKPNEVQKCTN